MVVTITECTLERYWQFEVLVIIVEADEKLACLCFCSSHHSGYGVNEKSLFFCLQKVLVFYPSYNTERKTFTLGFLRGPVGRLNSKDRYDVLSSGNLRPQNATESSKLQLIALLLNLKKPMRNEKVMNEDCKDITTEGRRNRPKNLCKTCLSLRESEISMDIGRRRGHQIPFLACLDFLSLH